MRTLAGLLVLLLALGAAGCGGDDEGGAAEPAAAPTTITEAVSEAASTAEATVTSADTISPPTTAATSSGAPAGISAAEALAAPDGAQVTVSAALIDAATGPVMCDATTRSLPPQCVGGGLPVEGIQVADAPGAQTDGGVAWTALATVTGTMQGGTLTGASFAS